MMKIKMPVQIRGYILTTYRTKIKQNTITYYNPNAVLKKAHAHNKVLLQAGQDVETSAICYYQQRFQHDE